MSGSQKFGLGLNLGLIPKIGAEPESRAGSQKWGLGLNPRLSLNLRLDPKLGLSLNPGFNPKEELSLNPGLIVVPSGPISRENIPSASSSSRDHQQDPTNPPKFWGPFGPKPHHSPVPWVLALLIPPGDRGHGNLGMELWDGAGI